ncbi:MAG: hypothetical protein AAF726_04970 [Planctomycetota bacterium]
MIHSSLSVSIPTFLLAAVSLGLVRPTEEIDFSPRFAEGQSLTIEQSFSMDGVLDDLSVVLDGAEVVGGGVDVEMEVDMSMEYGEEIVAVRDGEIAQVLLTVEDQTGSFNGFFDAMGESDSIDEPIETSLVGHTFEITVDEEGETEVDDVTEGDVAPADEDEMLGLTHRNHFESFLPTEALDVGAEFDLAEPWLDEAREMMDSEMLGDLAEMEPEALDFIEALTESMFGGTELEATGTIRELEDGIATIDYDVSGFMSIDDLVSLIASAMPPEIGGEIPPGVEAVLEASFEMEGTGTYDVALGLMVGLELKGEYQVLFSGNADVQGSSGEAEATFSGAFSSTASITAE